MPNNNIYKFLYLFVFIFSQKIALENLFSFIYMFAFKYLNNNQNAFNLFLKIIYA